MPGALEGTISTPLGTVEKKTALIIGGGLVVIFGVVWWRSRNQPTDTLASESEINPATGYPFGSAEDAAAMAAQAAYITPTTPGGGGGGSGYPPGGTGFTNNAQWTQAAVEYMTAQGLIEDASLLSAALGVYITGAPATPNQKILIEQAIAFQGFPPLAGPNGYPPAINTAPVTPPSTTPPPTTTPPSGVPGGSWFNIPRGFVPTNQNGTSHVFTKVLSVTGWGAFTEAKKDKVWWHPNNVSVRSKHGNDWTKMKMLENIFVPRPY